jgi:hypothetical protein
VTESPRTDAFHHAMDHSPLSSCVASLEYDDNLGPRGFDPFLHLDQLRLQFAEFPLIYSARKLTLFLGAVLLLPDSVLTSIGSVGSHEPPIRQFCGLCDRDGTETFVSSTIVCAIPPSCMPGWWSGSGIFSSYPWQPLQGV